MIYNSFKKTVNDSSLQWDDNSTTTIKCMLVTSSYNADQDNHTFISDVDNEVSGTGYDTGGKEIVNRTIVVDNSNNRGIYDGNDAIWATSSITARGAVVYKDTGTPATSPLICYIDFTEDKISSDAEFKIQWNTLGVFYLN